MLKKMFLSISAVIAFSVLNAAPFISINGCARGYATASTLHLSCVGNTGECVHIGTAIKPNGQEGWYVDVNWACNGANWQRFWLVAYPSITEGPDETLVEGELE